MSKHRILTEIHQPIHIDYYPLLIEYEIYPNDRDRKLWFEKHANEVKCNPEFKKLLNEQCSNSWIVGEVLRVDKSRKYKLDVDIQQELDVGKISFDQLAERVIQLHDDLNKGHHGWAIIGYFLNIVVLTKRINDESGGTLLEVSAHELSGEEAETQILSLVKII